MEFHNLFRNYSPIKFRINNDVINRLQQNNPIIIDYDNIAYERINNKISKLFNKWQNKKKFIDHIPTLFFKTIFISFLILFLFSDKLCILSYDDKETKERKPRYTRIILICIIISLIYILNFTKNNIVDILSTIFA